MEDAGGSYRRTAVEEVAPVACSPGFDRRPVHGLEGQCDRRLLKFDCTPDMPKAQVMEKGPDRIPDSRFKSKALNWSQAMKGAHGDANQISPRES